MNKIKLAIKNNDMELLLIECKKNSYLEDKEIINLLNITIKENKLDFFQKIMDSYINPHVFWTTSNNLIKTKQYEFIKVLININKNKEEDRKKKNAYPDQLLFEFIDKDDLYFVDYLVKKEKASTKNIRENELTVLNECVKSNAIKCFDYFLSQGKNIHDFNDISLFTALDQKRYTMLEMILNVADSISPDIEQNFYRYGQVQKELSNKELLYLAQITGKFLKKSAILQNGLNYQLIKRGLYKNVEENLKKGFSPIGEENYDLMELAMNLKTNKVKYITLLLDYGSIITDIQISRLNLVEREKIENYPRFSKMKKELEKKYSYKGKGYINKI